MRMKLCCYMKASDSSSIRVTVLTSSMCFGEGRDHIQEVLNEQIANCILVGL